MASYHHLVGRRIFHTGLHLCTAESILHHFTGLFENTMKTLVDKVSEFLASL